MIEDMFDAFEDDMDDDMFESLDQKKIDTAYKAIEVIFDFLSEEEVQEVIEKLIVNYEPVMW
jgi:hypothetical protein